MYSCTEDVYKKKTKSPRGNDFICNFKEWDAGELTINNLLILYQNPPIGFIKMSFKCIVDEAYRSIQEV